VPRYGLTYGLTYGRMLNRMLTRRKSGLTYGLIYGMTIVNIRFNIIFTAFSTFQHVGQFKFRDQMLVSPDCDMLGGGMLSFWN
jgi:hypothetical protein